MTQDQNPGKIVGWVLAVAVLLGLLMAWAMWSYSGTGWMVGMGGMMAFGAIWMVLPLILVIVLLSRVGMSTVSQAPNQDAQSIVESRNARGEIGCEEYLRMREDRQSRPPR